MSRGKCCVVDQHCTAAANHEGNYTSAVCGGCGEHVCPNCSMVVKGAIFDWLNGRWCTNCLQEGARQEDSLDVHHQTVLTKYIKKLYKMAGYKITNKTARSIARDWYGFEEAASICKCCKQEIK